MNGLEMALKAAGLSEVLDAAKKIAESGAVQKIIEFADQMEGLRNDVRDIKAHIAANDGRNLLSADAGRDAEQSERRVAPGANGHDHGA